MTTVKPLPQALQAHELAELLPDMSEGEQKLLVESIQKLGQLQPIVLLDGKILDGRSRYAACITLGKKPVLRNYDPETDGPSPTEYVLASNINRRHLNTGQRALVYEKSLPHLEREAQERKKAAQFKANGSETETPAATGSKGSSAAKAAALAHVSEASIKTAKKIRKEAPDLADKVEKGEMSLNEANAELEERKETAPTTTERDDIAKEMFEPLKKAHDEDFAISVRDAVVLKSQEELQGFCDLSVEEQKTIKELVIRKWKIADALKFMQREVDRNDKISDLILRTLSTGTKKGTWTVDGWVVTIARAK